jgi:single-strand DNA-binding protein
MLNSAQLTGHVSNVTPAKAIGGETSVISFSIAQNYRYKNKSGEWVENARFHECQVFSYNKAAFNYAEKWLLKGTLVAVQGEITYNEYEKEGQKHVRMRLNVSSIIGLAKPKSEEEKAESRARYEASKTNPQPQNHSTMPQPQPLNQPKPQAPAPPASNQYDTDDLPF